MNHLIRIILLIALFSNIGMAANPNGKENKKMQLVDTITIESKDSFVPNVTIYTPTKEIYDDAVDITEYAGYTVYDLNNNPILKVKPSIDKPVR